jgi:hypothetical protein
VTVEIIVPAPAFPPVRKRATGKLQAVNPWLNSNDRLHRQQEAKITAAWRDAGAQAAAGLAPVAGLVLIWAHVYKPRNNRYDPQNFYPTGKAVVDGFRDAGLLVDDDWRHVVGPFMLHGGKGPDALTVTIGRVLENVVPLLPFANWQA